MKKLSGKIQKTNKINTLTESELSTFKDNLKDKILQYAKANPEFLREVGLKLGKDFTKNSTKDTEDYNKDLVSEIVDRATTVLMDMGLSKIDPGDSLRIDSFLDKTLGSNSNRLDGQTYESFPFSHRVEQELRAHFLLKTRKDDTFKSLMEKFQKLAPKYMSEDGINIVLEAYKRATERLSKTPISFPEPLEGNEQGQIIEIDNLEKIGIEGKLKVDQRKDTHDMLALTDLIDMMEGNDVHPVALGPGFLAKMMKEVRDLGGYGFIFIVENNKLKEIRYCRIVGDSCGFSPMMAAIMMLNFVRFKIERLDAHYYYSNLEKVDPKTYKIDTETEVRRKFLAKRIEKYSKEPGFVNMIQENEKDFLKDNLKYYIVCDGCVALSEDKTPFNYEAPAKNTIREKAGEVYLLEGKDPRLTRLYFYPYQYTNIHPLHQTGSAIFGSNDQSYHPCEEDIGFWNHPMRNEYLDMCALDESWSPSYTAGRIHNIPKKPPLHLFKEEHVKALKDVMHSVYDMTDYTMHYYLEYLKTSKIWTFINAGETSYEVVKELVKDYAPLNRRWLLSTYLKDGSGIDKLQPTYFRVLGKRAKVRDIFKEAEVIASISKRHKK